MKMYRPHRLCPRNSKPKEPSLYRSLCVSILCMFLSTVMLVGTTMAWFSDSLQTGMYTISSANFTVTTYFCSELAGEGHANNWQRLNPSNTTMFGGGSLSSGKYQTAYLKIVNDSDIKLRYTLEITGGSAGNPTLPLSLAFEEFENEVDLNTVFTSLDEASTQSSENDSTDTKISFGVPAGKTKYVALKLSLNDTATDSPNQAQTAPQYNFSLRLDITQNVDGAETTASNSPTTSTQVTMEIGDTPSTPDTTASDDTNSGNDSTPASSANNTDPLTGSTTGTEGTGTSESGDTGTTGTTSDTGTSDGNGDTTVTENGSET